MNILLVEDQKEKSDDVTKFLEEYFDGQLDVTLCKSLRSGLKALFTNDSINIIILDMSMPNFDPGPDDPIGGTPESFAGREFLAQMDLRDINIPVIVVTQYSTFARGQIELDDLDAFFKVSYSGFYKGSVYYSSADDSWKEQLKNMLMEAI